MPSSTQEERDAREQEEDARRVRSALGGGIGGQKPDVNKLTARQGQSLDVIDNLLDLDGFDPSIIPVRPNEASLPKLTQKDLLPPPSSKPRPLDFEEDPDAPLFV